MESFLSNESDKTSKPKTSAATADRSVLVTPAQIAAIIAEYIVMVQPFCRGSSERSRLYMQPRRSSVW